MAKAEKWLTELERLTRASSADEGYRTVTEIAASLALSTGIARKRLKAVLRLGRLQRRQELRETLDGRMASVPVYRIRAEKEK